MTLYFKKKKKIKVCVANNVHFKDKIENWENVYLFRDLDSFLTLKDFSDKIEVGISKCDCFSYCIMMNCVSKVDALHNSLNQ